MGFRTACQGAQVVAALEAAHDPPAGMAPGHVHDARRDPDKILLHQAHLAEVIAAVGVEAGTDEDHLRRMGLKPVNPHHLDDLAHIHAPGMGRDRHVHQIRSIRAGTPDRIEGMLVETGHQDALVPGDDVFGAVAVVDVEVDDGHPLQPMALQRVLGRNRHVVEKAEAHRLVTARMMARRSDGAEGVVQFPRHDRIGCCQRGAGGAQGGIPGMDIEGGVRVDLGVRRSTRLDLFAQHVAQAAQGRHMHAAMGQFDVRKRSRIGLASVQGIAQAGRMEVVVNGIEPLGALGMARPHFMFAAIGVREIACFVHGRPMSSVFRITSCHGCTTENHFNSRSA
ncbi:MAG: hypothetical protein BWX79_02517 [Alphaproteobacteria bacterium ADurb.Bin100]|nr:MAG: hypothetical protein BWX79_02517 [Alphaproteobacteria bacterium ADurb.Bin100]